MCGSVAVGRCGAEDWPAARPTLTLWRQAGSGRAILWPRLLQRPKAPVATVAQEPILLSIYSCILYLPNDTDQHLRCLRCLLLPGLVLRRDPATAVSTVLAGCSCVGQKTYLDIATHIVAECWAACANNVKTNNWAKRLLVCC